MTGEHAVAEHRAPHPRNWKLLILGLSLFAMLLAVACFLVWWWMVFMPGSTFRGDLPQLSAQQHGIRDELHGHVRKLAAEIGERNLDRYPALEQAADYIYAQFESSGYTPQRQTFQVRNLDCHNIEVRLPGVAEPDQLVVIGAHYDSALGTPGANDNASGVAAMLALARRLAGTEFDRTLCFVAFTNEEWPYFQTPDMGAYAYARQLWQEDRQVAAMLSLETIGYFDSTAGSQKYPPPFGAFYPSAGNFVAVVGNVGSRPLVHRVVEAFRRSAQFPSEGGAIPASVPGVGWSDHWAFWEHGYPAVMVTDTAPFRYPHYHKSTDTPEKINLDHMARIVEGLLQVAAELAGHTGNQ